MPISTSQLPPQIACERYYIYDIEFTITEDIWGVTTN